MSRYDLIDFEWRGIASLLQNKPGGVPRVEAQVDVIEALVELDLPLDAPVTMGAPIGSVPTRP